MTTVVLLADPPGAVAPLGALVPDLLSATEARQLSRAMLADVAVTVQRGEADLLVNYPADDRSVASGLRDLLDGAAPEPDSVRYEPQIGSNRAARVGNALTHLLCEEEKKSAAVVDQTAVFLRREHVGRAAMLLRTSDVVLGPAPGGRVAFAGFREPIEFTDSYATPTLATFAERAAAAALGVDFLPMTPLVERPADLTTALAVLAARRTADRRLPPRTAALLDGWDLSVAADGSLSRPSDND